MKAMTKSEYTYLRLYDDIINGNFPVGSKLVIADLAALYEVSAMPVRDAIAKLEALGYVYSSAHHGAYVNRMNLKDFFTYMLLRTDAEALASRFTAFERTDDVLLQLEECIRRMDVARQSNQPDAYGVANSDFHNIFYLSCNNQALINQIEILMKRTQLFSSFFSLPDMIEDSFREHKMLLDALRNRDAEKCISILRYQRYRANVNVLKYLRDTPLNQIDNHFLRDAMNNETCMNDILFFLNLFESLKERNRFE